MPFNAGSRTDTLEKHLQMCEQRFRGLEARQLPGIKYVVRLFLETLGDSFHVDVETSNHSDGSACHLVGVKALKLEGDARKKLTKGAELSFRLGNEVMRRV